MIDQRAGFLGIDDIGFRVRWWDGAETDAMTLGEAVHEAIEYGERADVFSIVTGTVHYRVKGGV